ncbi:MAG: hypothetical protein KAW41_00780 [Candidatus Diapherotrites archaeon]|nr:hypothetical protein [Candidatus Diapherotrites archaeon]
MQQSYTIRLDPVFKKEFEELVEQSKLYSNVSEAVRDAMREKAIQLRMRRWDAVAKKWADRLKKEGVTLEDLERAMFDKDYKDKLAEEFDREKGFI